MDQGGWCLFMCAPDRSHNHACRVFASVAPQQRHLVARNCSIPRKRRLADTSSDAGMTLDESTGLTLEKRWHLVPIGSFAGTWRNLSSPSPRVGLAGVSSRRAVPEMRRACRIVPDSPVSPTCTGLCLSLSFRRRVLAALQQSTALKHPALLLRKLSPASFPARGSPWLSPKPLARRGRLRRSTKNAMDEVRVCKPPPDAMSYNARETNENLLYRRHHASDGC